MTSQDLIAELQAGRQRFLAVVGELRPELHRYCARMVGSIADGEDIVQDTLARAYYALSELEALPPLRPWLFRIAHNRAIDFRRRYDQRMQQPLDAVMASVHDPDPGPEDTLARDRAVAAAISQFIELAPLQRSCVILKDVLDHSLEDIAALLDVSVPAVKAALHRGRTRLRELADEPDDLPLAKLSDADRDRLGAYVAHFNARDFDAIRAMIADDVRLELVSKTRMNGKAEVSRYFGNYDKVGDWRLVSGLLEGRPAILVFDPNEPDAGPKYFMLLQWSADKVATIRDFRHAAYVIDGAEYRI